MIQAPLTAAPAERASDFAPLVGAVNRLGLLGRRRGYYATSIAVNATLLSATFVALFLLGKSWWVLFFALPAGIFTARSLFVGHDAAHQQITASRRSNRIIGLVHGNLLTGLSYGWWNTKHSRHHANPNDIDRDPDIGAGVVVWTPEQAAATRGLGRFIASYQGWLYLPLLLLEGINLKVSSVLDLRSRPVRERRQETALLALHFAAYLTLVFLALPPLPGVVFIAAHQAVLGLHLGLAFAPNHKGMPMPGAGERWSHLRKQVITSRNVRGGIVTDWFLGGLNYQIEHHLFSSMPRPHLRLAQPLVRAHCVAVGLPYVETSLVESYRQALRHVHGVGERLRAEV